MIDYTNKTRATVNWLKAATFDQPWWTPAGAGRHGVAANRTRACTVAHVTFGSFLFGRSDWAVLRCTGLGAGRQASILSSGANVKWPQSAAWLGLRSPNVLGHSP